MREVDAEGLGLDAEDLAAGVALCRSDEVAGWRCDPVSFVIGEHAEETYRPHGDVAAWPIAPPSDPASEVASVRHAGESPPITAVDDRLPDQPRILVFVSSEHLWDGWLQAVVEVASARDGTVVLAAVGELPESARHAAEERDALGRMLGMAARHFGVSVGGMAIELGGDPAHGLLTLAEETRADVIVLPHEVARLRRGNALAREVEARGDVPVMLVDRAGAVQHPSRIGNHSERDGA